MQVTQNSITEKQTVLERQVRSKEIPTPNGPSIQSPKIEEHGSDKGAAQNETSQYLKVLSRVENLLIQDKLPDAASGGRCVIKASALPKSMKIGRASCRERV